MNSGAKEMLLPTDIVHSMQHFCDGAIDGFSDLIWLIIGAFSMKLKLSYRSYGLFV